MKPVAFRLARRLLTDPRVQAWAVAQAIRMAPHVAAAGRRAAASKLPSSLLRTVQRALRREGSPGSSRTRS